MISGTRLSVSRTFLPGDERLLEDGFFIDFAVVFGIAAPVRGMSIGKQWEVSEIQV